MKDDEVNPTIIHHNVVNIAFNDSCCDQNEIVCVSFIISDFNGKIKHKIALVRSYYEADKIHADEVVITHSEKELL